MATQVEILKAFLEDPILQKKYGITKQDISRINFSENESSPIIALIKEVIRIIEADEMTVNAAASRINTFLDNRLR